MLARQQMQAYKPKNYVIFIPCAKEEKYLNLHHVKCHIYLWQ